MTKPNLPGHRSFEQEWRRRFERLASGATAEHQISGWSEPGLRRRVDVFERLLALQTPRRDPTALDLGSGPGTYVRLLAARGYRTVGADYSLPILLRARELDVAHVGQYAAADAYALPFADAAFDMVSMIGIFQAISNPPAALGEARRVLRPGGHLILEVLNAEGALIYTRGLMEQIRHVPQRVRAYRPAEVEGWLRSTGLRPRARVPVFLPPRRYPALEPLLDYPVSRWILYNGPGVARIAAAAFLILSVREDSSDPGRPPKP